MDKNLDAFSNKNMTKMLLLSPEKYKLKWQWASIPHLLELLKLEKLTVSSVDKGMEEF
jgi:hypothetical protein